VVEHYLDTVGVTGSNPVSRTTFKRHLNPLRVDGNGLLPHLREHLGAKDFFRVKEAGLGGGNCVCPVSHQSAVSKGQAAAVTQTGAPEIEFDRLDFPIC
jgi:hypothetical protein